MTRCSDCRASVSASGHRVGAGERNAMSAPDSRTAARSRPAA
ncbi:MAG TPA: hypothetical protein VHZ03_23090 [Trebonia sp.]|nr:hypothetical protein [Trebonia sp.]